MNLNKKLVFHFYVSSDFETNEAAKLHLLLLSEFTGIFNETVMVVSYDKSVSQEIIERAKLSIFSSIKSKLVTIKLLENTPLREAKTFYDEVVDSKCDNKKCELIFFGHSKGYSNKINESVIDWIIGLYYLSLNFEGEATNSLLWNTERFNSLFFGSFLLIKDKEFNVFEDSVYSGAFFWVNKCDIENNRERLPKIDNRFYAERFPYRAITALQSKCSAHRGWGALYNLFDFYGKNTGQNEAIVAIQDILTEEEFFGYIKFKEGILNKLYK